MTSTRAVPIQSTAARAAGATAIIRGPSQVLPEAAHGAGVGEAERAMRARAVFVVGFGIGSELGAAARARPVLGIGADRDLGEADHACLGVLREGTVRPQRGAKPDPGLPVGEAGLPNTTGAHVVFTAGCC